MAYFKIADLVALDEIREVMEMDAKPSSKPQKEEDTVSRFWDAVFSLGDQEDFNNDEYSENARSYWERFDLD